MVWPLLKVPLGSIIIIILAIRARLYRIHTTQTRPKLFSFFFLWPRFVLLSRLHCLVICLLFYGSQLSTLLFPAAAALLNYFCNSKRLQIMRLSANVFNMRIKMSHLSFFLRKPTHCSPLKNCSRTAHLIQQLHLIIPFEYYATSWR